MDQNLLEIIPQLVLVFISFVKRTIVSGKKAFLAEIAEDFFFKYLRSSKIG